MAGSLRAMSPCTAASPMAAFSSSARTFSGAARVTSSITPSSGSSAHAPSRHSHTASSRTNTPSTRRTPRAVIAIALLVMSLSPWVLTISMASSSRYRSWVSGLIPSRRTLVSVAKFCFSALRVSMSVEPT